MFLYVFDPIKNRFYFWVKMEMVKCLLIVDDSSVVRASLRAILADDYAGLAVHCEEAADGRQAIAKQDES